MNTILLLGDSHLKKCHDQAETDGKCLNFDNSKFKCEWKTGLEQIKDVENLFAELNKEKKLSPTIVLLVGGYDIVLANQIKAIPQKFNTLTHSMISSGKVKQIVVCSILDKWEKDVTKAGKEKTVKNLNKGLAKLFQRKNNIYFVNIRPHGKPNDFLLEEDKYHLKPEGYQQLYTKIENVLTQKIFSSEAAAEPIREKPILTKPSAKKPRIHSSESASTKSQDSKINSSAAVESTNSQSASTLEQGSIPMGKRLGEFKKILTNDYTRLCKEEENLTMEFESIQTKLNDTKHERSEIEETYQKLFGSKISLPKE